ncbi:MAG: hypothetical protein WCN87_02960 [Chlamydiota bacterium]
MHIIRWIGVVLMAAGITLFFVSDHIGELVDKGAYQVQEGQDKINNGTALFSLNPLTEGIGRELVAPEQAQVNQGKAKVEHYATVEEKVHKSGVILAVIGAILIALSFLRFK